MKLLAKYNRINITASIFIFIIGSISFYFILHYVLIRQLDETLRSEQQEIHEYVEVHHQLPDIQNTKHQWVTIEPSPQILSKRIINSYNYFNPKEKEWESVRQLRFSINVNGIDYNISVNKSEVETDEILKLIILVTVIMVALILLFNLFINRRIIHRLWQPFYHSINAIKNYHVHEKQALTLPQVSIDEFNLLNDSLNKMTQNIDAEYQALKTFTENASHEMQTPLAVIRFKTEMLLQQPELAEDAIKNILEIEESTQRLSRLHQSLLLLTKLENAQFNFDEPVNLKELIEQKISERKELLESKQISYTLNLGDRVVVFHRHLAEILLNNLLNNALKYTPQHGRISILLSQDEMQIRNTAANGKLDEHKIFNRFYKEQQSQDGVGLGLAIVFEIVKTSGFSIRYDFEDQQHIFSVSFKSR